MLPTCVQMRVAVANLGADDADGMAAGVNETVEPAQRVVIRRKDKQAGVIAQWVLPSNENEGTAFEGIIGRSRGGDRPRAADRVPVERLPYREGGEHSDGPTDRHGTSDIFLSPSDTSCGLRLFIPCDFSAASHSTTRFNERETSSGHLKSRVEL